MRWIADILYFIAGVLYLPVAFYNALVRKKNRTGWGERFGAVPCFPAGRKRIWLHAVSLGEVNATPSLVALLETRLPDCEIVISTTTDTGYARAVQYYGVDRVFRFPLDFSFVVARALKRIQPSVIVLVELEVWYNHVRMASRRGIPVVVVNGRLTERSARRFGLLGALARPMFADLAWVAAQDELIASRFKALGVCPDRVEVTSSLKWDSATVADRVDGMDALIEAIGIDPDRTLWVCGSTGPGEELIALGAYRILLDTVSAEPEDAIGSAGAAELRKPQLVIVPRKPERFDEVRKLIERAGFSCVRRSDYPDGSSPAKSGERSVILGDTMGELRKFYALANVVFVGRSLVPMGGSDPIEVAALGKPIVVGPHTENFAMPVKALKEAGAVFFVQDSETLAASVLNLLQNESMASDAGGRARSVVTENQGATGRTVTGVIRLIDQMNI